MKEVKPMMMEKENLVLSLSRKIVNEQKTDDDVGVEEEGDNGVGVVDDKDNV